MPAIKKLIEMQEFGGSRQTVGLSMHVISEFAIHDANLLQAINEAYQIFIELKSTDPDITDPDILTLDEVDQVAAIQLGIVNFYPSDVLNPYVALAACGPWIVTSKGAVVHDSGGYGMLGFGHAPAEVIQAMAQNQVMANVMTANFSQQRLIRALQKEVGHTLGYCPFAGFLFLNSGSEAVSVGARISDINAWHATDVGAVHVGKKIKRVALKGGFHGRTDRPAQYSDSTQPIYKKYLASFRDRDNLLTVEPNNRQQLQQVFERAKAQGMFIESMFIEPVMGEGNPGQAISREFYDLARELTRQHGSLLLVDSIQAGLRAHGCLSIVDYPGFEGIEAPDMETWSKALNAGQYPLSVLALTEKTSALYRKGVYGNTMTTNPRALDVACQALSQMTAEVRQNIRSMGDELVTKMKVLSEQLDGLITAVQGTGLLCSCELHPDFKSYGQDSIEEYMRLHGIGVIHGGKNSLRFTPHFYVTSKEIDLIIAGLKQALLFGPRSSKPQVL
jgi:acetylornithine/succinyldiaminopimelate/putrescine aminotransferase